MRNNVEAFSQESLQDYLECPRRFQLRYLLGIRDPAPLAEPPADADRALARGVAFHRLVRQHCLGLPPERITATIDDAELMRWWQAYLTHHPVDLRLPHFPEINLSATLNGHRLLARYDLLVVAEDRVIIFDWKTSAQRPPDHALRRRMQTIVYPYVLVRAGAAFHQGIPLRPEQIEMRYWFAQFPDQPAIFSYSAAQMEEDERFLAALIDEIDSRDPASSWPLTDEIKRCSWCAYRALCDRGEAGMVEEMETEAWEEDLSLSWDQVAEIDLY